MASYSAVIDLRVNGLEQLKEIEDRVKAVQNIQKRLKPIPSIFDKRASKEVKAAKEELSSYVKEVAEGTAEGGHFSKTMAGLNAQMRAFNTVAANSNAASDEFVASITAAERASRKLTEAEIDRLQVLSKIYTQQQGIGNTTATQEIIDLGKIIPKSIAGLELYEQQLRDAQRQAISGSSDYRALAEAIAEVNRQLDIARGLGRVQGPALPPGFTEAGATGFPRSPLSARPKTRTRQKGSPLVGAAFPALFGAGPAGILGGFVGEFFGPLGGVVGSALGAPVDAFVAEVAKTGVALTSASGTFDLVKEKSLFSSEEVKKLAYALEEQGKVQELATLLTTDLAKQIGSQGVTALQEAGTETKEFTRLVNLLFTQLGAFVAGPLSDFLSFINKALGSVTTNVQFRSFEASLQGNQAKRFAEIVAEERGGKTTNVRGGGRTQFVPGTLTTDVQRRALARAEKEGIAPKVTGLTTLEDTQTITPPKGRTGRSPGEREADRVAKILIQQRAVTLEIQRQSTFSAKIAAAEAAKDPLLVRRLKGEQELTELGVRTAKALELEKNSAAQLAIAKAAQAKADLIRQETAQDIAAIEQKRKEDFQNSIRDLDYELQIKQAVTEEDRERLRIEAEIAKLRGQNIYTEEQLLEIQARKQKLAAPVRGADLIRQEAGKVRDELNSLTDIGTQVVNAASAIGDAFSNSFKGIISGAMTAQEALASFFQNIADYFLDMAAQIIAKMIQMAILNAVVGLLPGSGGVGSKGGFSGDTLAQFNASAAQYRANGGPVSAGSPYVVGEKGPELFVPGRSGTIVPNSSLGGANVVVNVDASGSSAQGNQTNASALGRAIGAAVQAELVKQKRPGGLLA